MGSNVFLKNVTKDSLLWLVTTTRIIHITPKNQELNGKCTMELIFESSHQEFSKIKPSSFCKIDGIN